MCQWLWLHKNLFIEFFFNNDRAKTMKNSKICLIWPYRLNFIGHFWPFMVIMHCENLVFMIIWYSNILKESIIMVFDLRIINAMYSHIRVDAFIVCTFRAITVIYILYKFVWSFDYIIILIFYDTFDISTSRDVCIHC